MKKHKRKLHHTAKLCRSSVILFSVMTTFYLIQITPTIEGLRIRQNRRQRALANHLHIAAVACPTLSAISVDASWLHWRRGQASSNLATTSRGRSSWLHCWCCCMPSSTWPVENRIRARLAIGHGSCLGRSFRLRLFDRMWEPLSCRLLTSLARGRSTNWAGCRQNSRSQRVIP